MSKPTSPFSKTTPVVPVAAAHTPPAVVPNNQPFGTVLQPATIVAITRKDIDMLGSDIQVNVGRTSNKIVSSLTASQFGDLGSILSQVQNTAEKLDPSKKFTGITGWFRSKMVDVKTYLRHEYQSAEKVFDQLVVEMTKHIAVHDNWIRNLDLIFEENRQNYNTLRHLIEKAEQWKAHLELQKASLPKIAADDPDAVMKAHEHRELDALIQSLDRKLDEFRRSKVLCENNVPRIKQQQQTSDDTKSTIRMIIDFTIPVIRQEFALYMHSLDTQKSQNLLQNTKTLAQQTLVKSADAASEAAISATKSLNSPAIDNPTLEHIREKILFTASEVKRLEAEASNQRQADAVAIEQSTRQFVAQLQSN